MQDKISQEVLSQWRSNPTTKIFLTYLSDYANAQAESVKQLLLKGAKIDKETLGEVGILCATIDDIVNLNADDVNSFYKQGEKENE